MSPFSVVIICKNEAEVIEKTLRSLQGVTDNVVVYDNGSSDNTVAVAQDFTNVQIHRGAWYGFGKTKQKATDLAAYDWVLSLDADEAIDPLLQQQLQSLHLGDEKTVYRLQFKTFLGSRELKWGEWGHDSHIRLFNRKTVRWNEANVHEELMLPAGTKEKKLEGFVLHYTMKDMAEYSTKMTRYALLNAEKYFGQGKQSTRIKRYLGGPFAFVKYYILKLGFLDGWEGLVCARMTAFYTSLKYTRLYELQSLQKET